jgi:hypothetical protein
MNPFMHLRWDPQIAESTDVPDNWTADHIIPQHLKHWIPDLKSWTIELGEAQALSNRIGNLALLPRPTNSAATSRRIDRRLLDKGAAKDIQSNKSLVDEKMS